jgi:hypothetical protein
MTSRTSSNIVSMKTKQYVAFLQTDSHWEVATGLSRLVRGNAEEKLRAIFDKQSSRIRGPIMITAANASTGGTRIDPAKSPLADPFAAEVLGDRQSFMTISARH